MATWTRQTTQGESRETSLCAWHILIKTKASLVKCVDLPLWPCVAAVSGTEDYAREHGRDDIIGATVEEFRKELGM